MSALSAWWSERSKRPLAVAGVALVGAALLTWAPVGASAADEPVVVGRSAAAKPAYSQTKRLERVFVNAAGEREVQIQNDVTVTADQTRNLRGRQRINIAWKGAQPSGGRASSPYGEKGMAQEYPVVVLQCRGVDSASVAAAQRLTPETCWTATNLQRSQVAVSRGAAVWTKDLDASADYRQPFSGIDPNPASCKSAVVPDLWTRLTPFRPLKGTAFPACSSDTMPPEAAVGAAFPPAEVAAFTDTEGNGSIQFEVRSDVENESLGCSNKVKCAVVVIPIVGLSCAQEESPATPVDQACRRGGQHLPGSSNFAGQGVDAAVSPSYWWSPSNWKHRFTVPITFGLPPNTCDVLDSRPATGFYGSELLAQAGLQWAPAYCLDKKRFKFQHNQMSDEAGFNLMEKGGGAAAIVSSAHERKGDDPVGYAPTAVTGFGIGYVIDRPNNAGEYERLRLNPRLLAKLLTQSYLGSDLGRDHPGIKENPLGLMSDPEFTKLNPGLKLDSQETGATLLGLANASDVVEQLTAYIAADEAAMAFVNGKADPWGMKVNPAYRKVSLPRSSWPLLDEYIPKTGSTCRQQNPAVYFSQLAAPVPTMRRISESLLDAWPNVQTKCEYDAPTALYKVGRVDRQSYGARFMLGLVSLGDAARFGIRTAALQAKGGSYVAATDASLGAAVKLAEREKRYGAFEISQQDLRRSTRAYPGTMVVYTAARLRNAGQEDADKVAQFIRVSITEGQRPGSGNGQLPGGFLPITKRGVTAELYAAAQEVATAVEKQRPAPTPKPSGTPSSTPSTAAPAVDAADPPAAAPTGVAPSAAPSAVPTVSATTAPVATDPTASISSGTASRVMPTLLLIGLLGIALASLLRFVVQGPRRR
ncbi:hypothetical protein [Nocardioides lianchengensis]|uniref:Uncharacterized protein n=1 Tax=Nocardioides lianchengensis TaxID=1045774 RepID=A0A1G6VVM6_9ACTN|nr:hypothetical protein [Nocardioides lianchengensis]NYG11308.1 hypothetical protein [Nocardioides lianchengensis]SDD57473.1 hypothetical protein SAMN05421872_10964 [Nocardioides lianchengensis]